MRTIIVVFTDRKVSLNEVSSYKKYKFLCNYDTVSLYDMVEDPRYTGKMMVVGFTCDTDRVQQGITLKDIYITKVNGQVINQPAGLVNDSLAGSDFDIDRQRNNNMENWQVNKVFYYEVNGRKFYNKSEADEYSLKLFLTEEITKLWRKSEVWDDHSIYIDDDNKTIIVCIYHEPLVDDWNVGHYGCTAPTINDKNEYKKYSTIQEFYKHYDSFIVELFKIADSIDIEKLSMICAEEAINKMNLYKSMVEQLKTKIK